MGFYATSELLEKPRPARAGCGPKNRVWGFFADPNKRTRFDRPQPVETHRVASPAPTKTAPGVSVYGFRSFDPVTGRWASRDPIGEEGGLNLYGFLRNNAINGTDTLGLVEYSVTIYPAPYTSPDGKTHIDPTEDSIRENLERLEKRVKDAGIKNQLFFPVKDLKDANEKLTKCDCIKVLHIEGHGNEGFQNISSIKDPNRSRTGRITYKVLGNAPGSRPRGSGFEVFKGVNFCKPECTVIIRGCFTGRDAGIFFLNAIATATGCKTAGFSRTCQAQRGGRSSPGGQLRPDRLVPAPAGGGKLELFLK